MYPSTLIFQLVDASIDPKIRVGGGIDQPINQGRWMHLPTLIFYSTLTTCFNIMFNFFLFFIFAQQGGSVAGSDGPLAGGKNQSTGGKINIQAKKSIHGQQKQLEARNLLSKMQSPCNQNAIPRRVLRPKCNPASNQLITKFILRNLSGQFIDSIQTSM